MFGKKGVNTHTNNIRLPLESLPCVLEWEKHNNSFPTKTYAYP